jgi:hypothetical protein
VIAPWNGSSWRVETVDSERDVGAWTSFEVNGSGNVHISYYGVTSGDLEHAVGVIPEPATLSPACLAALGLLRKRPQRG